MKDVLKADLHESIVKEYSNIDSTKSLSDIAKEYGISRQRVHQILKYHLSQNELTMLKTQKATIRHADVENKERERRKRSNMFKVTLTSKNVIKSMVVEVEFYRIIINGTPTQLFYNDILKQFVKYQRISTENKEKAGFLINEPFIKHRTTVITKDTIQKFFNKKEHAYKIIT